jgi:hypothetical protein
MGIDIKKIKNAKFKDRIEEIKVDKLKDFFPNGEKPIWKIRAISGEEMYFVRNAVERSRNTEEVISQLLSGSEKQKASAALKALGLDEKDLPEDYIRRLHILKYGSIDPDLRKEVEGLEVCKKIAEGHPTIFDLLTNRIMALTGLGKLGESIAFGTTKKSKVA